MDRRHKKYILILGLAVIASLAYFCFSQGWGIKNIKKVSNVPQIPQDTNTPTQPLKETVSITPNQKPTADPLSYSKDKVTPDTQIIPILMYHYIEAAPATSSLPGLYLEPSIFEAQAKEIKKAGYQTKYISEVATAIKNHRVFASPSLALTFDDGYEDFYTQAWPILKKYQIKATLYVIINDLDKPGYISTAQLRELAQSDIIEIGSHTFNHPNLKNLNPRQSDYEIRLSRLALSRLVGRPILSFAYPFGLYTAEDLKIAASAGYEAALSTNPGSKHNRANLMNLSRLRPSQRQGQDFLDWLKRWER